MAPPPSATFFNASFWKRIFSNSDQEETSSVKNADDLELKHHALHKDAYDEDLRTDPTTVFNRKNLHVPRILYLLMCAVGSFIISGGLEFAIAYGMYKNTIDRVRLWRLPDTLSGDLAVTNFVQAVLTYWIESALVQADLRSGLVKPLYFGRFPRNTFMREIMRAKPKYNFHFILFRWIEWLAFTALRALFWSIPLWFLLWPAAIGILCAPGQHSGNDYFYNNYPAPQVIKLIFGGILGFIFTPWIAFLHMYMYGHYRYLEENQQQITGNKDLESQRNASSSAIGSAVGVGAAAGGAGAGAYDGARTGSGANGSAYGGSDTNGGSGANATFPSSAGNNVYSEQTATTPTSSAPPTSLINHFPTPSPRHDSGITSSEGLAGTSEAPESTNMPSSKPTTRADPLASHDSSFADRHPHPMLSTHTTTVYDNSVVAPANHAVQPDDERLYNSLDHSTEFGSPIESTMSPEMVHRTTFVNENLHRNDSIQSRSYNSGYDSSDNDGFSLVTAPSIAQTSSAVNSATPSVNGDANEEDELSDSASTDTSVTTKKPN
ncbi:DUF2456 family conserved fungal protein [Schizosaccharomyces osmophilus]|uniref:DUF2456 family conserved fungal protein n=1 Tax=Schizosaccharomyces osmophilus TaxID=2545709 RepID=A0AAE9WHP3_9SCHI|nr:DUF2456 family conserved fungal protein [Schizosaccharomyces osmophilus]WBW74693.1 DUF2456 family conserved fungal protein [Schizosaccharomyces osmophilus]